MELTTVVPLLFMWFYPEAHSLYVSCIKFGGFLLVRVKLCKLCIKESFSFHTVKWETNEKQQTISGSAYRNTKSQKVLALTYPLTFFRQARTCSLGWRVKQTSIQAFSLWIDYLNVLTGSILIADKLWSYCTSEPLLTSSEILIPKLSSFMIFFTI